MRVFLFLSLFLFVMQLNSQDLKVGFQAGLNTSKFSGPEEVHPSREGKESIVWSTGFHFGPNFTFMITDLVGIGTGLHFIQKGSKSSYDGDSFFHFSENASFGSATGRKKLSLEVYNSSLLIPITVTGVFFEKFELFGGVYGSWIVSSTGVGKVEFEGLSDISNTKVGPFTYNLDYNFFKDEAGEAISDESFLVRVDGEEYNIPEEAGAYNFVENKDDGLFKRADLGLHAGFKIFVSRALYLGSSFHYGLSDITKTEQDFSITTPGANREFLPRDDKDRQLSWLFSLGFSF